MSFRNADHPLQLLFRQDRAGGIARQVQDQKVQPPVFCRFLQRIQIRLPVCRIQRQFCHLRPEAGGVPGKLLIPRGEHHHAVFRFNEFIHHMLAGIHASRCRGDVFRSAGFIHGQDLPLEFITAGDGTVIQHQFGKKARFQGLEFFQTQCVTAGFGHVHLRQRFIAGHPLLCSEFTEHRRTPLTGSPSPARISGS